MKNTTPRKKGLPKIGQMKIWQYALVTVGIILTFLFIKKQVDAGNVPIVSDYLGDKGGADSTASATTPPAGAIPVQATLATVYTR